MQARTETSRRRDGLHDAVRHLAHTAAPGTTTYRVVRVNERPALGALNASGQVAYSELTEDGGWVAKFYDGNTTVTIGTLGGRSAFVQDLNNSGQVTGFSNFDESGSFHAFRWSRATGIIDLGTLAGSQDSLAVDINNRGLAVGYAIFQESGVSRAILWDPLTGLRDLGTLGGTGALALAINDGGRVAGNSVTVDGTGVAFSWTEAGGMIGLLPPGALSSDARDINASGQIVGNFNPPEGGWQVFLWTPGAGFRVLGEHFAFPFALSDTGMVCGVLMDQRAFVWTRLLGMVDIGTLPGGGFSNAYNLNNRGQVVGESTTASALHAFLWTDEEGMIDLNTRLRSAPPAELQSARHINDNGVILASTSAGLVLLVPDAGGNQAPIVGPINVSGAAQSQRPLAFVASFTYLNPRSTHQAIWSWGDGSEEPGMLIQANGAGNVSGQHTYDAPGSYTAELTVSDNKGERTTVARTVIVS